MRWWTRPDVTISPSSPRGSDNAKHRWNGSGGVDRTIVRYRSQRPDETQARERIRALTGERRRFGYRRLHWLLGREGIIMNHK